MRPGAEHAHDCAEALRLSAMLREDDVDAAIEAGLMDFHACEACDASAGATIEATQRRLADAWRARDRFEARRSRLQRRAAERQAARKVPESISNTSHASASPAPTEESAAALPPAVAALLARAKAKAAGAP